MRERFPRCDYFVVVQDFEPGDHDLRVHWHSRASVSLPIVVRLSVFLLVFRCVFEVSTNGRPSSQNRAPVCIATPTARSLPPTTSLSSSGLMHHVLNVVSEPEPASESTSTTSFHFNSLRVLLTFLTLYHGTHTLPVPTDYIHLPVCSHLLFHLRF